jgi:hypothetical protein
LVLALAAAALGLGAPGAGAQSLCLPGIALPGCPTPEPPPPGNPPPKEYPEPASACPVQTYPARSSFVGVYADDVFVAGPEYRNCTLSRQATSGVSLIRAQLLWSYVETSPGKYDWRFYDAYVEALARHNIRFLPMIITPPKFRSTAPEGHPRTPFFKPKSNADLAAFTGAAARRYGPGGEFWPKHPSVPYLPVRSWQVWNEPNISIFWPSGPNAREYVAMLRDVSLSIRTVDPKAEIVSAGIPDSRLGIPLRIYVRQMLRAGARKWMNTLAVNGYSTTSKGVIAHLAGVRRLLDRTRARKVRLWITEVGWASAGPAHPYNKGPVGQARRVKALFSGLQKRRRALKLRGVVYFNWQDTPPYRDDFWGLHLGLEELGGKPKPAYFAFRSAATRLR